MAYRYHGRASVDPSRPAAFATCERCGFLCNHRSLQFQYDFRGRKLTNLQILVCDTCLDAPQNQLRPVILPPDPIPIDNPRPEPYTADESDYRTTQAGDRRVTVAGDPRVTNDGSIG